MDAMESHWRAASDQLLAFVRRRVRDPLAAEDIRQDVLLRMYERLDTLRDAKKVQQWMYQIARNAIVDYYRSGIPADGLPDDLPDVPDQVADARREMAGWMRPFIAMLPEMYRRAIWLSEIEGVTHQEVADRLHLSLSAAKSRVRRGKLMLKDLLTDCCRFEFDQHGRVVDYEQRHSDCCSN